MALKYVVDEQDAAELARVRAELTAWRQQLGMPLELLSESLGRNKEFVSSLEKGRRDSPYVASLQLWAGGLGMRVEFGLENFWLHSHADREMLALFAMSRPWGADEMGRLWLLAALSTWRQLQGVSLAHVATGLGMTQDAVRRWELESTDPVLKRAMATARMCGTRLTMSLWRRPDWTFG